MENAEETNPESERAKIEIEKLKAEGVFDVADIDVNKLISEDLENFLKFYRGETEPSEIERLNLSLRDRKKERPETFNSSVADLYAYMVNQVVGGNYHKKTP